MSLSEAQIKKFLVELKEEVQSVLERWEKRVVGSLNNPQSESDDDEADSDFEAPASPKKPTKDLLPKKKAEMKPEKRGRRAKNSEPPTEKKPKDQDIGEETFNSSQFAMLVEVKQKKTAVKPDTPESEHEEEEEEEEEEEDGDYQNCFGTESEEEKPAELPDYSLRPKTLDTLGELLGEIEHATHPRSSQLLAQLDRLISTSFNAKCLNLLMESGAVNVIDRIIGKWNDEMKNEWAELKAKWKKLGNSLPNSSEDWGRLSKRFREAVKKANYSEIRASLNVISDRCSEKGKSGMKECLKSIEVFAGETKNKELKERAESLLSKQKSKPSPKPNTS